MSRQANNSYHRNSIASDGVLSQENDETPLEECITRNSFGLEPHVSLLGTLMSESREIDSRNSIPRNSVPLPSSSLDKEIPDQNPDPIQGLTRHFESIETRIRSLESRLLGTSNGSASDQKTVNSQRSSITESMRQPALPEIHRVPWFEFKHKFVDDPKVYAIEVLDGPPRYYYQRRRNAGLQLEEALLKQAKTPRLDTEGGQTPVTYGGSTWSDLPDRIRINSWPVLLILSRISSENWALKPKIFLRPYKLFTYYRQQIRKEFEHLEDKFANDDLDANNRNDSSSFDRYSIQCTCSVCTKSLSSLSLTHSLEAYRDMRCLINFMDQYIQPTLERFRSNQTKICFADLWWIFDSGHDVYAQASSSSAPVMSRDFHSVWRILGCSGGRPNLSPPSGKVEELSATADTNPLVITCYYIDFTGTAYTEVVSSFSIHPFDGQKDITSLLVYPLRFHPNGLQLREEKIARGKKFQEFHVHKHMYYRGLTLNRQPSGEFLADEYAAKSPEYVDSKVIVDFRTTLENNPDWTPKYKGSIYPPSFPKQFEEDFALQYWYDRDRRSLKEKIDELIHNDEGIGIKYMEDFTYKDAFLRTADTGDASDFILDDSDLVLLPARVFGFILKNRKFAQLHIGRLSPVKPREDSFGGLILLDGHRETVQALVQSHFEDKQNRHEVDDYNEHDIVQGKGTGLIVLLHGVPGVGKTSTAECVADAEGKPLFPITCGDLGLTAKEVEKELEKKFSLAQRWNCILLLDEADVFLAERVGNDLERNSIVSVFLRVLEYYTGILFLTTNRVGVLDEAVVSRIHSKLYYPPLEKRQALEIWKANIDRLRRSRSISVDLDRKDILKKPTKKVNSSEIPFSLHRTSQSRASAIDIPQSQSHQYLDNVDEDDDVQGYNNTQPHTDGDEDDEDDEEGFENDSANGNRYRYK